MTLSLSKPRPASPARPERPSASFRDLGLCDELVAALDTAGMSTPFPIQELTIPDALAGRDVCGKAKTGSGKTLAFGLPLIQRTEPARRRRPHALVLVPTRELANQVATALAPMAESRGLYLTAIYGGASMVRQIRDLHSGADIVIATPGRLNDLLDRRELSVAEVATVVIDEADQMADMGFLPQVRAILERIETRHQTLLFSATLDGAIGSLVAEYQHDPVRHEVVSPTASVETLEQRFIGVERLHKLKVAATICAAGRRSLVFVRTKHGADRLARQLSGEGVAAAAIHGGLNQNRRERTLAAFASGRSPVLVATNVAARGLHVDDIDTVLHFDLPEDGKTYLHRSGRTARAGADGLVVTLVLPEEARQARSLQNEAGIRVATVTMQPGDERLLDLGAWTPPVSAPGTADRDGHTAEFRAQRGFHSRRDPQARRANRQNAWQTPNERARREHAGRTSHTGKGA